MDYSSFRNSPITLDGYRRILFFNYINITDLKMNPKEKPIKVSDWSQKYKLAIYAISGGGMIYFAIRILQALDQIKNLLQIIASR